MKAQGREAQAALDAQALVRETHHRVGNHLQILASLVGLQARRHPNQPVREALLDVRRRILAIARINSELQQNEGAELIQLPTFLARLREDLRMCFGDEWDFEIKIEFEVDPSQVTVEKAVTLALIINELVTNAVKHAALPFGGSIIVQLRRLPDGELRLTVCDDGPGFPVEAVATTDEHGFDLVRMLVQRLHGNLTVLKPERGAAIAVTFH